MGETRYPLGGNGSVRFGDDDYRCSCLCTFPFNYNNHKIGAEEVKSLALIGAALVMYNNGGLIKNKYDYENEGYHEYTLPDCIPEWVRDDIRKAVGDYPEQFDCNYDIYDNAKFATKRLKKIVAWANKEIKSLKEDYKMETGTVKWYNPKKGYGFITRDKGGDVFFHISELKINPSNHIDTGRGVSFTIENNEKGEIAKAIELTGCNLDELRKMWKERGCSIKIGRNSSGYIGYKMVEHEDGSVVLGENFESVLPDIECYYYAYEEV